VASSLVFMYARRRSVRDAVRLFDEMPERLLNETPTVWFP
jgi:pentatricopeptide repeat protein